VTNGVVVSAGTAWSRPLILGASPVSTAAMAASMPHCRVGDRVVDVVQWHGLGEVEDGQVLVDDRVVGEFLEERGGARVGGQGGVSRR
jgi:hypothetical protein